MAEIDSDALSNATKALTIIFIILIVPINAGLIFKIVKQNLSKFRFMSDPKKLTIISLAIGDIFLALFYLVISALYMFQGEEIWTCRKTFLAFSYGNYLIHFVYGTGLVVLAVELIMRMRRSSTGGQNIVKDILLAVITSALPWTLGPVIILPLTIVPQDLDTCGLAISTWRSTLQAWYIVSMCIPASLALLFSIFTLCIPQRINPAPSDPNVAQALSQNPTTNISPDSSIKYIMPPQPTTAPGYNPQYPQASNPYPPQPYPWDATPPPQYTSPAQNQQQLSYYQENVFIPQPTHNLLQTSTNFNKEKITLFLVSLMYFMCVIPKAVYFLDYALDLDGQVTDLAVNVIYNIISWLAICRSVLTPLIWMCRLDG